MNNFRLRLVLLGLALGVIVAVVVASQGGCGTDRHPRHVKTGAGAAIVSKRADGR